MRRGLRLFALMAGLAAFAPAAHAQYRYPGGYGGYGWGGFGGGGGTVGGSVARGMGAFAAGAGSYNVQTAQARSINTSTAMQWDNYLWQAQQTVNRIHLDNVVKENKGRDRARSEIYSRLRDHPTVDDINKGDALNVDPGRTQQPPDLPPRPEGCGPQDRRHGHPRHPVREGLRGRHRQHVSPGP